MKESVTCEGLRRSFGKHEALRGVSFRLPENTICGLIGRNGAGKTTLLHVMAGQLPPGEGSVKVLGRTPFENAAAQRTICIVRDRHDFPGGMRVGRILQLASLFYPNWDDAYAASLLALFELDPGKKVKSLSRGMESALGIIIGLASRAPVTLFDEPNLGLDAVARVRFYEELLEDYQLHPRTIVLSTHLIDEAAKLFERVLMIDRGVLLLDAEAEALRGRYVAVTGQADEVERFAAGRTVYGGRRLGSVMSVTVEGPFSDRELRAAGEAGLSVSGLSLQELLVQLTDEGAQAAPAMEKEASA